MAVNSQPIGVIARLLDLSERRVQQLSRDGVIPKAERGQYDLVAAVRGYVAYLRDLAIKAQAGAPDFGVERARLGVGQGGSRAGSSITWSSTAGRRVRRPGRRSPGSSAAHGRMPMAPRCRLPGSRSTPATRRRRSMPGRGRRALLRWRR